mmetsp:Transcript_35412/g.92619  ORF Transcript_35412/g.92619 Transcript_35412/m.92619 type:complete len:258 (+) Transcript_35412:353-1126(+)
MRSPGSSVTRSSRASCTGSSPSLSRHILLDVSASSQNSPPSKATQKWSRLRNSMHSLVTARSCSSGWCLRPTSSGLSPSGVGPTLRWRRGTSATPSPQSSSTTEGKPSSFSDFATPCGAAAAAAGRAPADTVRRSSATSPRLSHGEGSRCGSCTRAGAGAAPSVAAVRMSRAAGAPRAAVYALVLGAHIVPTAASGSSFRLTGAAMPRAVTGGAAVSEAVVLGGSAARVSGSCCGEGASEGLRLGGAHPATAWSFRK